MTRLALLLAGSVLAGCVVRTAPPPPRPGGPVAAAERRDDRMDRRTEAMTGWEKLGERWVEGRNDRDSIPVGRAEGRFTTLLVKAEHSALELFDMLVVFGDGSSWSPNTRLVFGEGSTSRQIDLPGGARVIRRVEFRYGNLPGGGRAQLELWGR